MQLRPYQVLSWPSDTRLLGETCRQGLLDRERTQEKVELALSEGARRIEVGGLRRVMLEVGRHKFLAEVVELDHIAG